MSTRPRFVLIVLVLVLVLVLENTVPANRTRCLIHFRAGKEVLMGVARATQ